MTAHQPLYHWLTQSQQGQALLVQEESFFQEALHRQKDDFVLSLDSPSWSFSAHEVAHHFIQQNQFEQRDVVANTLYTPWREHQFSTLIACHVLDTSDTLTEQLSEWRRITREQGKLLLTTFNPYTFGWAKKSDFPFYAQLKHTPTHIINCAENVGWQLEHCRFLVYRPQWSQTSWQHRLCTIVLPQTAMVYGLIFSKQTACLPPPYFNINPILFNQLNLNTQTSRQSSFRQPES